jgi:hypothetical protein
MIRVSNLLFYKWQKANLKKNSVCQDTLPTNYVKHSFREAKWESLVQGWSEKEGDLLDRISGIKCVLLFILRDRAGKNNFLKIWV